MAIDASAGMRYLAKLNTLHRDLGWKVIEISEIFSCQKFTCKKRRWKDSRKDRRFWIE